MLALATCRVARPFDVLPGAEGPMLREVEPTEPSLFLHHDDGGAARAAAVFRSLAW